MILNSGAWFIFFFMILSPSCVSVKPGCRCASTLMKLENNRNKINNVWLLNIKTKILKDDYSLNSYLSLLEIIFSLSMNLFSENFMIGSPTMRNIFIAFDFSKAF